MCMAQPNDAYLACLKYFQFVWIFNEMFLCLLQLFLPPFGKSAIFCFVLDSLTHCTSHLLPTSSVGPRSYCNWSQKLLQLLWRKAVLRFVQTFQPYGTDFKKFQKLSVKHKSALRAYCFVSCNQYLITYFDKDSRDFWSWADTFGFAQRTESNSIHLLELFNWQLHVSVKPFTTARSKWSGATALQCDAPMPLYTATKP